MLHYNVHFEFRDNADDDHGLAVIKTFLEEICQTAEISGYRLLKNTSAGPKTKLKRFQALIEFRDSAHLDATMEKQRQRGIHSGSHGAVVRAVANFHVEIFETIDPPVTF